MKMSQTESEANNLKNGGGSRFKMISKSQDPNLTFDERLKILYPMVNEEETPIPRSWSSKDKFNYITLSRNNLRVQYKGHGKTHKDASSVRAAHPIPASCGVYYFEVKIISKGRDGYMGVGLCAQGVNMNRLPGWDKHSYGFHGDDGHSFCSSGTGQPYGPTFTTGDVIGCGLNLVDGTCFYTKNGHHLGIAFTDLPSQLYPTVGLQTPGEVVDANFGQEPFMFDIEGEMSESRSRIHRSIENYPAPGKHGDWQMTLNKLMCSYLVHHGFCDTAKAFAEASGQEIAEDWESIRNRKTIQNLVLDGKMGKVISLIDSLYPGFLQMNANLHFMLKVRQFIEMVGGQDCCDVDNNSADEDGGSSDANKSDASDSDVVMSNGKESSNGNTSTSKQEETSMDVDPPPSRGMSFNSNPDRFAYLIQFGRGLRLMQQEMDVLNGYGSEANNRMLQDAFALLAYPDPWDSPVGWQLEVGQREQVSSALNSALLEARGFPSRPPIEVSLRHAKHLVKLMSVNDLGACAFANVEDFVK